MTSHAMSRVREGAPTGRLYWRRITGQWAMPTITSGQLRSRRWSWQIRMRGVRPRHRCRSNRMLRVGADANRRHRPTDDSRTTSGWCCSIQVVRRDPRLIRCAVSQATISMCSRDAAGIVAARPVQWQTSIRQAVDVTIAGIPHRWPITVLCAT